MNTASGLNRYTLSISMIACIAITLMLSACKLVNASASILPAPPMATQSPAEKSIDITFDFSGVARDQLIETVAEVPASAGGPYWESGPEYRRVTLQGYPVTSHLMKPQIFIYPAADLSESNEAAGQVAVDLHKLLQVRQPVERMPFLPLLNASQVMHSQVQFLSFKNGEGVRFLTQFDQGPLPINNGELIYTFQGLTGDGKYIIAAVLPVTHPELPSTQQVSTHQAAELSDFPSYLKKTVTWLNQQSGNSFTPDLSSLDTLVQLIEVK
jgi:hypothetical protein